MKLVIDDKIPFIKGVLEPFFDVVYMNGAAIENEDLKDVDGLIIRTRTKCNEELLQGTKVKIIATATIGFDHIDTEYCEKAGIKWGNAPGCNSSSVQQYIASALISLSKKHGFNLQNRTLGIIGVGNVGRKVLRVAEQLGMRVVLNDPPRQRKENSCAFISLEGILRESDIITFHVPLTMDGEDKTFHLANENLLNKVSEGTIIINSSRGEVVDNNALLQALNSGKVSGAVLDVWENEPKINTELLEKVDIATPHIAGYSQDGKANGTAMSVESVCDFFDIPFQGWYPVDVPQPEKPTIKINCKNKTSQQVLQEAMWHTYNIDRDDNILRSSVGTFEKQRGGYPVRREFGAYTVDVVKASKEIINSFKKIGFKINNEL